MQKRISVLTSTYNYGHFIHRLLDSILSQTYENIEMVIIDDGSKDDTKQVIEGYIGKFAGKGYSLIYVYQENQGLACAVNNGLKLVTGDYLVWPDADDWYAEQNALEIMVAALDNTSHDTSCCRVLAYYIDDGNFNIIGKTRHNAMENLFTECLFPKDFVFTPGITMVKTSVLFNQLDHRSIYTGKNYFGQNWQILLPVLYKRKCVVLDEYLYNILVNTNSCSRKSYSFEKLLERNKMYLNALMATIDSMKDMSNEEKIFYTKKLKTKYFNSELKICFAHKRQKEAKRLYKQMLAENKSLEIKTKMFYHLCLVPFGFSLLKLLRESKQKRIR